MYAMARALVLSYLYPSSELCISFFWAIYTIVFETWERFVGEAPQWFHNCEYSYAKEAAKYFTSFYLLSRAYGSRFINHFVCQTILSQIYLIATWWLEGHWRNSNTEGEQRNIMARSKDWLALYLNVHWVMRPTISSEFDKFHKIASLRLVIERTGVAEYLQKARTDRSAEYSQHT